MSSSHLSPSSPFLPLPNLEPGASAIAACCQLLFHAHKLSGRQLFHFINPEPISQAFASLISYGGDSMEVDDNKGQPWDLFFSKLSPKSLQDSPVQFYEKLIQNLSRSMSRDSLDMITCKAKEIITSGCKKCESIVEDMEIAYHLKIEKDIYTYSRNKLSEEWKKSLSYQMFRSCACGKVVQMLNSYKHWPKFLFVAPPDNAYYIVNACAQSLFEIGHSMKATYQLVGAVVHNYSTNVATLLSEAQWYNQGAVISNASEGPKLRGYAKLLLFQAVARSETVREVDAITAVPRSLPSPSSLQGASPPGLTPTTTSSSTPTTSSTIRPLQTGNETSTAASASSSSACWPSTASSGSWVPMAYTSPAASTAFSASTTYTASTASTPFMKSSEPMASIMSSASSANYFFATTEESACYSVCFLLYTAHLYSGRRLFSRLHTESVPTVKAFEILMAQDFHSEWKLFYRCLQQNKLVDAGTTSEFFDVLFVIICEQLSAEFKQLIFSETHRTTTGCKTCSGTPRDELLSFLKYYGSETFGSSSEFSALWKAQFQTSRKCDCRKTLLETRTCTRWPLVLFVKADSTSEIISRSARYPFDLAETSGQATYELVGSLYGQHQIIVKDLDGKWSIRDATSVVKWNDLHEIYQHYKAQVLLFIRKEQRGADCESLQMTQLKTSANLPRTPVLELGNQGNSCWAAACCQLLYCAHMHSGQALFSFRHWRQPPCVENFHALMNHSDSKHSWRSFYTNLFTIPGLDVEKYEQSDSGLFYEAFIKYLLPFMSDDAKRQLLCMEVERTARCPRVQCTGGYSRTENAQCSFLRYAGREDFGSTKEFSDEWKRLFESQERCWKCGSTAQKTNYFRYWPRYLFVRSTSDDTMIRSTIRYPFTLDSQRAPVTYKLLGAAIHTGVSSFGHYIALVNQHDHWYSCSDGQFHEVNPSRMKPVNGTVQLMVFVRD